MKQGLKSRYLTGSGGSPQNEILNRIVEVTGLGHTTVSRYLSIKFKQTEQARTEPREKQTPASERVANKLGPEVTAIMQFRAALATFKVSFLAWDYVCF